MTADHFSDFYGLITIQILITINEEGSDNCSFTK